MKASEVNALGLAAGRARGSWVFDGNTSEEYVRKVLEGYEEGDPEVMDLCPASPLSGESAGESLIELGLEDASDEDLDGYEEAFSEGFWEEVQRAGNAVL